jgi:hypothetical protein
MPDSTNRPDSPDEDGFRKAYRWWVGLRAIRKAGFIAGVICFLASYEYEHDFGVKHPFVALAGVLLMIFSGTTRSSG